MPNHSLHPVHAILVAGALPLFLGVFLTDLTYWNTFEIQWKNFASWLLVAAEVFAGLALVWAIVDAIRFRHERRTTLIALVVTLLVLWILGFVNSLVHAGDAWGSMPRGLVLSVIAALLAIVATWLAFAGGHRHTVRVPA